MRNIPQSIQHSNVMDLNEVMKFRVFQKDLILTHLFMLLNVHAQLMCVVNICWSMLKNLLFCF